MRIKTASRFLSSLPFFIYHPFPSRHAPFYMGLGHVVVAWGILESILDHLIRALYLEYGHAVENEVPRQLKRKIKFLKKAAVMLEVLKPYSEKIIELCEQIGKHADSRHNLIHGYFLPDSNYIYTLEKIEKFTEENPFKIARRPLSPEEILDVAEAALKIQSEFLPLAQQIVSKLSEIYWSKRRANSEQNSSEPSHS
jgi:hypothetical protein